jgi:thioredoxin reductase (NADPH)
VAEPIVFVVDDDPDILSALGEALERRFGGEYRIMTDVSPASALERISEACDAGAAVALVLSGSLEWLASVHDVCPGAARCVLVRYGDGGAYPSVRRSLVLGEVETYILTPPGDPEERLYPVVGEILGRWMRQRRPRVPVLRIVGEPWARRCHELRDRLSRASVAWEFVAHDSDDGRGLLERAGHTGNLPAVIFGRTCLADPTDVQVARMLGAHTEPDGGVYDVVVVGGGPAGLSAAVIGASDGLRMLVVERHAFGGQAGTSSLIRNYVGFPRGISGAELASRAHEQAISLGAEFIITRRVTALERSGAARRLVLDEGTEVLARTVVVATGVAYNILDCDGVAPLVGKGVFYGAATAEAPAFAGRDVFVVGAGNSAGQAAIHLARYAGTVTLVVRSGALTMSDYLVKQIERTPSIHIRLDTQLVRAEGTRRLEAVHLFNAATGESERLHGAAVFVLIGAGPHTTWLEKAVQRDAHGHLLTGRYVVRGAAGTPAWTEAREPLALETSLPGVFAAGDVRHRSPRGVAAAVADGALAVRSVLEYLAD